MIDRIQSVDRLQRKRKPVVYIDLETREQLDRHLRLVLAYKVDNDPVKIIENSS